MVRGWSSTEPRVDGRNRRSRWGLRPRTIATIASIRSDSHRAWVDSASSTSRRHFRREWSIASTVWLRIRNTKTNLVTFGSRESTTKADADAGCRRSGSANQDEAHLGHLGGSGVANAHTRRRAYLLVDGQSKAEAYLKFDVSDWRGKTYSSLRLQIKVRTAGGAGVSVSRVGSSWKEFDPHVEDPPGRMGTAGKSHRGANHRSAADRSELGISGWPDLGRHLRGADRNDKLARLRLLVARRSDRRDPGDRSRSRARQLPLRRRRPPRHQRPVLHRLRQRRPPPAQPDVIPSPTVDPIRKRLPDSDSDTRRHADGHADVDADADDPANGHARSHADSDRRAALLLLWPRHGPRCRHVPMGSQGTCVAGQTYEQILTFYYTGVDFSTIDGTLPIRVRLGDSFWPTATKPARVTGHIGGWQSASFPGMTFAQGSYVEMVPNLRPRLHDPCGLVPDPTPTRRHNDRTMDGNGLRRHRCRSRDDNHNGPDCRSDGPGRRPMDGFP